MSRGSYWYNVICELIIRFFSITECCLEYMKSVAVIQKKSVDTVSVKYWEAISRRVSDLTKKVGLHVHEQ